MKKDKTRIKYGICDFNKDVTRLAAKIRRSNKSYSGIYGIPRGGIPVAMALSQKLKLPVVSHIDDESILIVDDLVDSGMTFKRFSRFGNDYACLHYKNHTPKECMPTYVLDCMDRWVDYWWEAGALDEQVGIQDNIMRILQFIGENPHRDGLVETPARIERMFKEFFCGYDPSQMPKMTKVANGADGVDYDQMLRDEGYFFSYCEHHMVPFFGNYYFGYIPNRWILGASKISRVIDYYAGRLQIAERLVHDVVSCIEREIEPHGLILIMKARHLCKEMRGIRKWNSPYEAIAVRGYFANNRNGCKDEFMSRIPI